VGPGEGVTSKERTSFFGSRKYAPHCFASEFTAIVHDSLPGIAKSA